MEIHGKRHHYHALSSAILVLSLSTLLGVDECESPDVDGDGWTIEEGDCADMDETAHPGADEACDGVDDDCDGEIDEECTYEGPFTGPMPDAPGGQRIMDDAGNIYYSTYAGGMYRVPEGGGISEFLFGKSDVGCYGFLGNTYVLDNALVLFDSGVNGVMAYNPEDGSLDTYADATSSNGYAFSVIVDAVGNIVVGRADLVIHTDASTESVSFLERYTATTSDWVYTLVGDAVYRQLHTGEEAEAFGVGLSDAYGLAVGTDGAVYVGQGNTKPSTIYRIPPEGGSAEAFSTVPIAVTAVLSDSNGWIYASGQPNNSLYRIDPISGESEVYGCDPSGC